MYFSDFFLNIVGWKLARVLGSQSTFIFTGDRMLLNPCLAIRHLLDRQRRLPQVSL